jgi:hypothetical protein
MEGGEEVMPTGNPRRARFVFAEVEGERNRILTISTHLQFSIVD